MTPSARKDRIVASCRKTWFEAGRGRWLAGVSGGADSTALALALSKAGIPFEAVHCNYNLRAEESLRDREFVKDLCRNLGVILHLEEFDVGAESLKGESVEMTCRRLRYQLFRKLKDQGEFSRIAIAHNEDDNVETFFLNALRGSGSRGLKAMEEDSGEIVRPLLCIPRKEILDFLEKSGQPYVTDSSNLLSDNYRRNFLRNEVFPLLESKWEGFTRAVSTTISLQKRDSRIVEHFISQALEGIDNMLPWDVIAGFPDAESLIYRFISRFGGSSAIAKEMAKSALSPTPGKTWRLDGMTYSFTRSGIKARQDDIAPMDPRQNFTWEKLEPSDFDFSKISSTPLSEAYFPEGPENYLWMKADSKMRIKSLGMEGSQSVWKVLKDAGIAKDERKEFPVLVEKESGQPLWLPGIKRSRLHLVDDTSQTVWRVRLHQNKA